MNTLFPNAELILTASYFQRIALHNTQHIVPYHLLQKINILNNLHCTFCVFVLILFIMRRWRLSSFRQYFHTW